MNKRVKKKVSLAESIKKKNSLHFNWINGLTFCVFCVLVELYAVRSITVLCHSFDEPKRNVSNRLSVKRVQKCWNGDEDVGVEKEFHEN